MEWYYLGLVGFLVLWEVMYLFQRKHPKGLSKLGFMVDPVDTSWFSCKIASFVNLLLCLLIITMGVVIVYGVCTSGVVKEIVVSLCAIGIFFGINYLLRGEEKKGRKK